MDNLGYVVQVGREWDDPLVVVVMEMRKMMVRCKQAQEELLVIV